MIARLMNSDLRCAFVYGTQPHIEHVFYRSLQRMLTRPFTVFSMDQKLQPRPCIRSLPYHHLVVVDTSTLVGPIPDRSSTTPIPVDVSAKPMIRGQLVIGVVTTVMHHALSSPGQVASDKAMKFLATPFVFNITKHNAFALSMILMDKASLGPRARSKSGLHVRL